MFQVKRLIVLSSIVATFGSCKKNDQSFDWENQFDLPAMILVMSPYDCPPCKPRIRHEISILMKSNDSMYPNKYIVTPGIRPLEIKKLVNEMQLKEQNWNKLNSKKMFRTLNDLPEKMIGAKLYLVKNPSEIEIKRLKKENSIINFSL